ncbi:MAG: hypothetical protein A3F67_12095 [Verrucomicrobia bacterium RIFCSPHIGHO2_12_FULL_41_10]|nr:MAG: hypothetical protein A3F67_12095 [Verrucomicrobia bacterium RIFCSPHIGHO2_12_FULL_41_10]
MWLSVVLCSFLSCSDSLGRPELLDDISYDEQIIETCFDTNVHVNVSFSYPQLPGTSPLIFYINKVVKNEAYILYDAYVQEMSISQEDVCAEEEYTGKQKEWLLKHERK